MGAGEKQVDVVGMGGKRVAEAAAYHGPCLFVPPKLLAEAISQANDIEAADTVTPAAGIS